MVTVSDEGVLGGRNFKIDLRQRPQCQEKDYIEGGIAIKGRDSKSLPLYSAECNRRRYSFHHIQNCIRIILESSRAFLEWEFSHTGGFWGNMLYNVQSITIL